MYRIKWFKLPAVEHVLIRLVRPVVSEEVSLLVVDASASFEAALVVCRAEEERQDCRCDRRHKLRRSAHFDKPRELRVTLVGCSEQREIIMPVTARAVVNSQAASLVMTVCIYNYSQHLASATGAIFESDASSYKTNMVFQPDFDTAGSNTTSSECTGDAIVLQRLAKASF